MTSSSDVLVAARVTYSVELVPDSYTRDLLTRSLGALDLTLMELHTGMNWCWATGPEDKCEALEALEMVQSAKVDDQVLEVPDPDR